MTAFIEIICILKILNFFGNFGFLTSLTHDIFIKVCQYKFEIDGPKYVEVSKIYPEISYTSVEDFFDEYLPLPLELEEQEKEGSLLSNLKMKEEKDGSLLSNLKMMEEKEGSLLSNLKMIEEKQGSLLSNLKMMEEKEGSLLSHLKMKEEKEGSLLSN